MITHTDLKDVLERYNIAEHTKNKILSSKRIYKRKDIEDVENVLNVLRQHQLLFLLDQCSSILALGKSEEIQTIIEILSRHSMLSLLQQCPYILARGKSGEIQAIIETLSQYSMLSMLDQCPYILAQGKSKEIKVIVEVLTPYSMLPILQQCPGVLAQGKSKEIKAIIEVLSRYSMLSLLQQCPYILARGKSGEIQAIIEVLTQYFMLSISQQCPTILAIGKANIIRENLNFLCQQNVDLAKLQCMPLLMVRKDIFKEIFSLRNKQKHDERFWQLAKIYMQLTGRYNKIMSRQDIQTLLDNLGVTEDEFLANIVAISNEKYLALDIQSLKNTLLQKGELFIGDSTVIPTEILKTQAESIQSLARRVATYLKKKYKYSNYDDVYDFVLNLIINKCGQIYINYLEQENITRFIFRYCVLSFKPQQHVTSSYDKVKNYKQYTMVTSRDENLPSYSFLELDEQELLNYISSCLSAGIKDYLAMTLRYFGMTQEELKTKLALIKEKMIQDPELKRKLYLN